jgi:hypothetical protein
MRRTFLAIELLCIEAESDAAGATELEAKYLGIPRGFMQPAPDGRRALPVAVIADCEIIRE